MRHQTAALLLSLMAATTFAGDTPALIPLPQKMECREGVFQLQPKTRVLTDVPANDTGQYLAERLVKATGYDLKMGRAPKHNRLKGRSF
jgi:Glycosyl hydrolase family 20, domain 2